MQISSLPSHPIKETEPNIVRRTFRVKTPLVLCIVAMLLAGSLAAWGTQTATTTTLTPGTKTINSHAITTLTAKVTPTTITQGLVRFYDGKVLLGTGQIVKTGTKYTHGTANLSVELGPGSHSLTAVFAGTSAYAGSSSTAASVVIGGGATSTTLTSTGTAGAYGLTAQVMAHGTTPVTGNVDFVDQTSDNAIVGTAALGTPSPWRGYLTAVPYSLYAPTGNDFPVQAVLVDLNGDGILDMAVLDDSTISVYLGKGDGTFLAAKSYCMTGTPPQPCGVGNEPSAIAVGDFNSDGIPDLVWVDGSNAYIALGNGDGTFQQPASFETQGDDTQVLVADLNRDGTPDLIVSIDDGVSILLGNGDGTFQPHYEESLNDASEYITIGDFNKDGIPDIASAGHNGSTLMVLLGNGDGTFKPEKDTPIDINTSGCTVAAADFKGAGFLSDMVICGGAGQAEALQGKGDGTFAAPQDLFANGNFSEYANWVIPVDLNGDGNVDIVLAWDSDASDAGRIGIFNGKGDGTFNTTPTTMTTGKQPVFATAGDVNGNGTPDLVTVNAYDNNLSVLVQGATSTATASLANVSLPGTGNQSVVAEYQGDTHYSDSTSPAITLTGSGLAGAPVISSLSPSTVVNGSGAFTLTVNGTGFATGDTVKWNGNARTTTYASATKLTAAILATDVAAAGTDAVTVVSTTTGTSNSVNFAVTQSTTGPTITALSPDYATINAPATTITIAGTSFVSGTTGSVVHFGPTQLATTYVNATTLTAVIPATSLKTLGTAQVAVWNAGPSISNTMPFTVGPVTHLPLAYGFFNKNGSAGATSGNITCTWTMAESYYACTITGESFFYSQYVANATIGDTNVAGMIAINSVNGQQLIVKIYNTSGTAIQAPFYIVVFKP
jgi:hypothetical protein